MFYTFNNHLYGKNGAFIGSAHIDFTRYLTLLQTSGGSISANKMSGYDNDIVTLSNTANTAYNFTRYDLTGATLTANQFKFNGSDVTAKGVFTQKPTRTVTINQQTGGTIQAIPTTGYDGTVVTLSNTANAGYTFNKYNITGASLTGNKFTLTGENVTVQPVWTHNVYSLTLQNDGHGTLAAGKTTGYYNDTTILTATPNEYYAFANYSVTGGSVSNNTYTWAASNGTVRANFKGNGAITGNGYKYDYSGNKAGIGDTQLRLTNVWRNERSHRELYPSTNINLSSVTASPSTPPKNYIVAAKYKLSLPSNTNFTNTVYLDTIGALKADSSAHCYAGACDRSINTNQIPVYSMRLNTINSTGLHWSASDVYSGNDMNLYVTHNNWTTGTKLKSYVISSNGYDYWLSSYYDEQLKAIGNGIIGNHEVLAENKLVLGAGVYSYESSSSGGGGGTNQWYFVSSYKPLPGNMTYQCRTFTNLNSAIAWANTDF